MNALGITVPLLLAHAMQSVALPPTDTAAGPYCGVYCFYAALRAHGRSARLEDLIDERYISSSLGSSLLDLKEAADDYKMFSLPLRGMTANMLRDSSHPVILHVRSARRGSPFLHWALYLGTEDGKARIIDPPNAPESVSFADLMSRWDGVGIVISNRETSTVRSARMGWMDHAMLGTTSTIVVLLTFALSQRAVPSRAKTLSAGAFAILVTGAGLGLAYHVVASEGFLGNPNAVAGVMTRHHASHLAEFSLDQLKRAMAERSPVIIDARVPGAHARGCIRTAISIPISATHSQRTQLLESVPRNAEIIVYCQSEGCVWSDELGSDLAFRGFTNVSVYRGGYREWAAAAAP